MMYISGSILRPETLSISFACTSKSYDCKEPSISPLKFLRRLILNNCQDSNHYYYIKIYFRDCPEIGGVSSSIKRASCLIVFSMDYVFCYFHLVHWRICTRLFLSGFICICINIFNYADTYQSRSTCGVNSSDSKIRHLKSKLVDFCNECFYTVRLNLKHSDNYLAVCFSFSCAS